MAESSSNSLSNLWNKLQKMLSKPPSLIASSSSPPIPCPPIPKLTQLNEMVYEVHKPRPEKIPELEIVFFHGLQLKPCKESYITTWMSRDDSQFWPQTWLAKAFPKARILTVSYDSTAKRTNQDGRLDMFCTSENLLSSLTSESVKLGEAGCPIVLVGHCLGGLLLKDLCLHTNATLTQKSAGMQRMDHFFKNLRGMFFYGTPHLGSSFGEELLESCKGSLLSDIEIFNASNVRRNENFSDLKSRHKWVTYGVGETHDTFLDCFGKGKHMRVVLEASSRPNMDGYYSADANHFDVCKPEVECSGAFLRLKDFLHKIHTEGLLQSQVAIDVVIGREYFVDDAGRVKKVKSMLAQPGGHTIFIVGLSGIGKSSLAKEVTRNISHTFSVTCFVHLDNIEAQSNKSDQFLGEQVLKKVQTVLERQDKGWNYNHFCVPQYLKGKKVLMVLDNVQSQCQLDALDRATWLDGTSSRMIVTTTKSRLGASKTPDQSNTFEVQCLDPDASRQLFCHYAFKGDAAPDCLANYVDLVAGKCEGFPLSLKILGSYLSKENVHDERLWEGLIQRLENAEEIVPDHDYRLWARLRPCYDALTDSEQEIFLDIANVFCGFPLDYVMRMWNACRISPHLAWRNLKQGFLVSETESSSIQMHGLLRAMGRRIACPTRSRIDKWRRVSDWGSTRHSIVHGVMETLSFELRVQRNERLTLRNTVFTQFVNLQYLILDGIETTEGSVELPSSLVYLGWKGGLFEACPLDFTHLENLVVLDLQFCEAMKVLPSSLGSAVKLEWLELAGCRLLTHLPLEVHRLIELEYLGLRMTGVTKLPNNLGKVKKLRYLQANNTQLASVPKSIVRLEILQDLNISHTAVKVLPESIGDLKSLIVLTASHTSLRSLPESIGEIGTLKYLDIAGTAVRVLPESICHLAHLRWLCAAGSLLSALPETIGRLQHLESLLLEHTRIKGLPRSFGDLVGLEYLCLRSTPLRTLPDSIGNLRSLWSLRLTSTRIKGLPQSFGDLAGLRYLYLGSTPLETVPDSIGNLRSLLDLDLSYTPLRTLPDWIGNLRSLGSLGLTSTRIKGLPQSFGDLAGLRHLHLGSTPLETVPDWIGNLRSLLELDLSYTQITTLPDSLGQLTTLNELRLEGLRLRSFPFTARNLFYLLRCSFTISTILNDCDHLSSPTVSTILGSHEDLNFSVNLHLDLTLNYEVPEEEEIGGPIVSLSALTSIPSFSSIYIVSITGHSYKQCLLPLLFDALQQIPGLKHLRISYFNEVEIMPPELGTLARLKTLEIKFCDKLRELPESLSNLPYLKKLILDGLPKLWRLPESLSTVSARRHLELEVLHCDSLQSMPRSFGHTSPTSKSWDDQCATSDSRLTLYPALDNARIVTDSRRVLGCLLQCCNLGRCTITFRVKCEEFERLRSRANGGTTVAMKLLREFLMECHTGDDDPHEIFGPSTSWFPLTHRSGLPKLNLRVSCMRQLHGYKISLTELIMMVIDEEDNCDTEEDSEKDEDEEDDEENNGDTEDSEKEEDSEKDEDEEDDEENNGYTEDSEKEEDSEKDEDEEGDEENNGDTERTVRKRRIVRKMKMKRTMRRIMETQRGQ